MVRCRKFRVNFDASKLRKEISKIEFNSDILGENEEKTNTLGLFKEHTRFLKNQKFKPKNQNFSQKKFRGQPKNETIRGN